MHREKIKIQERFGKRHALPGSKKPHPKHARSLRVLLVDDEANVRQSIALVLGIDGHMVTESSSGSIALQLLASGGFDLVITDYRMQGMNGDELARRIRALYPTTPVVMLTGFNDQSIGPENPVCAIFHKPDQIKDLRLAVGSFCHN